MYVAEKMEQVAGEEIRYAVLPDIGIVPWPWAKAYLMQDYNCNAADVPSVIAWSAKYVIFLVEYDGILRVNRVAKDPLVTDPPEKF